MSFKELYYTALIETGGTPHFGLVIAWGEKRKALSQQLKDLPYFVDAFKTRKEQRYNEHIYLVDLEPQIRLGIAYEATVNTLYSMADIAAIFGNKVTKHSGNRLPFSFNNISEKAKDSSLDPSLESALGDLQWYRKIREIRTELAHYSSIFIGENNNKEPLARIGDYRNSNDKQEFKGPILCTVQELILWTQKAIETIDNFGDYLLNKFILPQIDLKEWTVEPKCDPNGLPILLDGRPQNEKITKGEFLQRYGISVNVDSKSCENTI